MKRIGKRRSGRRSLLIILVLVVALVGAIAWVDSNSLPTITVPLTEEEAARAEASEALRSPRLARVAEVADLDPRTRSGEWHLIPIERSLSRNFMVSNVHLERCEPEKRAQCPEIYGLPPNEIGAALLATGEALYIREWPNNNDVNTYWGPQTRTKNAATNLAGRSVLRSREAGTDEEAMALFLDSAELLVEELLDPPEDAWVTAHSYSYNGALAYGLFRTAPEEVLRGAQQRCAVIAARIPRASDVARTILRRFDDEDIKNAPIVKHAGIEPVTDGIGERLYLVYKRRGVMQEVEENLDRMNEYKQTFLDTLDGPWRPSGVENDVTTSRASSFSSTADGVGVRPPIFEVKRIHAEIARWVASLETMIALELFRREQGRYPETLDALVPQYCDSLPIDPVTRTHLDYSADADGYALRSFHVFHLGIQSSGGSTVRSLVDTRLAAGQSQAFDVEGQQQQIAAPSPEACPPRWLALGPFTWEDEPLPRALLELPFSAEAIEAETGLVPYEVTPGGYGVVSLVDAAAESRGKAYLLRTTVHATQACEVWLRLNSYGLANVWHGTEGFNLSLSEDGLMFQRSQPGGSRNGMAASYAITLPAGETPILVRLLDYADDARFLLAIQNADGSLPEGVWFE